MPRVLSYRDLDVWKKSMHLAVMCYRLTAAFPRSELYGITSQIRRAAVSIPSNIAEGHIRRSRAVFINHLDIALGSQAELETQVDLSCRLGFITSAEEQEHLELIAEVGRMLNGLVTALERNDQSESK